MQKQPLQPISQSLIASPSRNRHQHISTCLSAQESSWSFVPKQCQRSSMLRKALHGNTKPYTVPAKGKQGTRHYQPAVVHGKTTFPITQLSFDHHRIINCLTLPSTFVVYRNQSTWDETMKHIVWFEAELSQQRGRVSTLKGHNHASDDDICSSENPSLKARKHALCADLFVMHTETLLSVVRTTDNSSECQDTLMGIQSIARYLREGLMSCGACERNFLEGLPRDVLVWFENMVK